MACCPLLSKSLGKIGLIVDAVFLTLLLKSQEIHEITDIRGIYVLMSPPFGLYQWHGPFNSLVYFCKCALWPISNREI